MEIEDVTYDLDAYLVAYIPLNNGEGEDVGEELTKLADIAANQRSYTVAELRLALTRVMRRLARKLEGADYGER